ncbi:hypothetical protein HMPREF1503_0647 [Olsenella uli MSTE5]|nr:hypothetical protein HMPREF1503_0647 [Olsenella uli MSTE5]
MVGASAAHLCPNGLHEIRYRRIVGVTCDPAAMLSRRCGRRTTCCGRCVTHRGWRAAERDAAGREKRTQREWHDARTDLAPPVPPLAGPLLAGCPRTGVAGCARVVRLARTLHPRPCQPCHPLRSFPRLTS